MTRPAEFNSVVWVSVWGKHVKDLLVFMRESKIETDIIAGGRSPIHLYGGFSAANAEKIKNWLKERNYPIEGEETTDVLK